MSILNACIWRNSRGYQLVVSERIEFNPSNFRSERIVSTADYATKPEAKRAAKAAGARPWNY